MARLVTIDEFDSFRWIKEFENRDISESVIKTVKSLNEKTQLEPFIRACLYDSNDTPHGPSEIVDILTTKVSYLYKKAYGAFILKGKSFKAIKAQDVSHQIYRLKKIGGLNVAIFAYTGNILDQPQEEFVNTCVEIGCDYSIWNDYDIARLLVSEGFICPRDGNVIDGEICSCGYNPKKEELNIFQHESIKQLGRAHILKQTSGLVVLPTGSGKTRVAVHDIYNQDAKCVIYIAHTTEILEGAAKEFLNYYSRAEIGVITTAKQAKDLKKINFITIQFLSKNTSQFSKSAFDYMVVDEFHHAAAKSYLKTINYFHYSFLLGLTATPFRADRKDIAEICDDNYIVNYELRDGIETGILSPYHYYGCFDDVDYTSIRFNGIAYDIRDLERALIIPERDTAIKKKWVEKAYNKPTIGFCCSIRHANRCCAKFLDAGISAEAYTSDISYDQRVDILERFKSGETKILFTVDILNEGIDFPFIECLLFLRPTESKRVFLQQLGRGLRRYPGKSQVIVLDFIGNFKNSYKIVEYFGLTPSENEDDSGKIISPKTYKEVFNLPTGCEVSFDENVITIFSQQYLDYDNINRYNIYRILTQQYVNLCIKLKKRARWRDIDKYCVLTSSVYDIMFNGVEDLISRVEDVLLKNDL